MSHPVWINLLSFFYPVGNTPAVCLERDVPLEVEAKVLSLGCGDVRNVLFTCYAGCGMESRQIDITCCDHEPAILARNILLFTLLLDYKDGSKNNHIWAIYYHLFLDDGSLKLLCSQSQKLLSVATSLKSWNNGEYGNTLRFCNTGTLSKVKDIWSSFGITSLSKGGQKAYRNRFEADLQRARHVRKPRAGNAYTALRSAGPLGFMSLGDAPKLAQKFWDQGLTDIGTYGKTDCKQPNPMFASGQGSPLILHYGTDPLTGFHLATAYAKLAPSSSLAPPKDLQGHKLAAAAQQQFFDWSNSFRAKAQKGLLKLRFFTGDALAFCHALQQKSGRAWIPRSLYACQYDFEPLILDSDDYVSDGAGPLLFNAIDTSNLLDHVGPVNLLTAVSPLMDSTAHATLYTEALVRSQKDLKATIEAALCGHFPTVSLLFGLLPLEYWTNATHASSADEHMISFIQADEKAGQSRYRLSWKRPPPKFADTPLAFDPNELASVPFRVYLDMFQSENLGQLFSSASLHTMTNASLLHYHRGSFAAFASFVKTRVSCNWKEATRALLDLIESDSSLITNLNYIQELYTQLHLFGVYSPPVLSLPPNSFNKQPVEGKGIETWQAIPAVVSVTVKVPRSHLRMITDIDLEELGTPVLQCTLESSRKGPGRPWQNVFSAVHVAFGEITTSGSRYDGSYTVNFSRASAGWNGSSDLIVSFFAPSWTLLLEPHSACISLGIQSTPFSARALMSRLGLNLTIYKTVLGDEDHVYVSEKQPNFARVASMSHHTMKSTAASSLPNGLANLTIKPIIEVETRKATRISGRLDIVADSVKAMLADGKPVITAQLSPFAIRVVFDSGEKSVDIVFPAPVAIAGSKCRVARKSSYVEVIAPMADFNEGRGIQELIFPAFPDPNGPVVWNVDRANFDHFPMLDVSAKKDLEWLTPHASLMLSERERSLRDKHMSSNASDHGDVRVKLKDSLFSMLMHFSGLQGGKAKCFGISVPDHGGVHVLVFVYCLRLDVNNLTVALDTAVLPLYDQLMPKLHSFLQRLTEVGLCSIIADEEELRLWKELLPGWIERCRHWRHRPSCEYLKKSKVPLTLELGENPICSCGQGTLPGNLDFGLPLWKIVAKYAVRAMISPIFPVPIIEDLFGGKDFVSEVPSEGGCVVCGQNTTPEGKPLMSCSACRSVKYCSASCQRKNWKEHKTVCKRAR